MRDCYSVPVEEAVEDAHTLHGDVTEPIEVTLGGDDALARVKRGSATEYEKRTVRVSGDGFTTYVPAGKLDLVIASLMEVRGKINDGELRVPNCVYCGEEHESVEGAREHFEEVHEDSGRHPPAEFDEEWYDPDPRGEMT